LETKNYKVEKIIDAFYVRLNNISFSALEIPLFENESDDSFDCRLTQILNILPKKLCFEC